MKQILQVLKHRPPFRILVTVLGLLFVSLQGWIRLVLSLVNWDFYTTIGVVPGVWYILLSGLITGCVYLVSSFFYLLEEGKYKRVASILLFIGLAAFWFDRIFAAVSPEARVSLPFELLSSLILTLAAIVILYWDTIKTSKFR